MVSIGCGAEPPIVPQSETSSTSAAQTTTAQTSGGESLGETLGETTSGGELDGCHALPAAAAVQWIESAPIESTAESSDARIADAGARTWDLALDLLRLTDPAVYPSVVSSPTSMTLSTALAYRRWQGTGCADSIHELMHFSETGDALHATLGASVRVLESRAMAGDAESDPVVLTQHQSMWELVEGSTDDISLVGDADYGATRHAVSKSGPEALAAIREVINCEIEEQSAGLLDEFLPNGVPDPTSASFDIDVAVLKSPWATALESGLHVQFTAGDGSESTLDAIGGLVTGAGFREDEQAVVLELPLRSNALAVTFVMPKRTALAEFVATTSADDLRAMVGGVVPTAADVTIPVVNIPSETIDYFVPFGFACDPDLELRRLFHAATITIDDKGIEAAAATVSEGGVDCSGVEPTDVVVVLDRPFAFFVHDRVTNHVLYSGRFAGE